MSYIKEKQRIIHDEGYFRLSMRIKPKKSCVEMMFWINNDAPFKIRWISGVLDELKW